jgi:hypothetical protein
MSDNFEKYMNDNQEGFDVKNPNPRIWQKIGEGLDAKAPAKPMGKWFLAGIALVTAVVTTVFIYFGGEKPPAPSSSTRGENSTEIASGVSLDGYDKFVKPAFQGLNVPYSTYPVSAKQGGKIETPNGTEIIVPENAFVDAKGNEVKGEVEIKYREFHNVAEVMASGIPMKFEEQGQTYDFQTAGMIDIRGESEGQPVFVADNKEIGIKMASFAKEKDYNLYFLDPVTQKWQELGQPESAMNEEKQQAINALPPLPEKPVAPQAQQQVEKAGVEFSPLGEQKPIKLDQKGVKNEFDFGVDWQQFPELKPFKSLKWKAVDESLVKKNPWIFTEVWSNMKFVAKDTEKREYSIELTNYRTKFTMVVTPLLDGKDFEKEFEKYKKLEAEFEAARLRQIEEMNRLQAQADMYRTFSVANFGIYNCDRYYQAGPNALSIVCTFNLNEDTYAKNFTVFHATGNGRALLTYNTNSPKITFNPAEDNCFIVVLPGNKVGIFSQSDFDNLDIEDLRKKGKHEFGFRTLDREIKSSNDLLDVISEKVAGRMANDNELPG